MPPAFSIALLIGVVSVDMSRSIARFSSNASFSFYTMENMSIHKLIREGRAKLGMTEQQFGNAVGVSRGAVQQWEKEGGTAPTRKNQPAVAALLGMSVAELMGQVEGSAKAINLDDNPDYPAIRRVSLKAQAGVTGYAVDYMNDDGPPIVFRKDWYALHGYRPEKMMALRVAGESMVPNLYAGDLIVINSLQTEPKDGIAFVCIYEGEVVVKRLVRDSGQWWLTSDNADQRRYPRKACDDSTQVVGEVVYRQTERI